MMITFSLFLSYFFFILQLLVNSLLVLVGILLTVAFYTLAERKVMAGVQRRKGPNVIGFWGVLQPLVDGLKLVLKENLIPIKADKMLFIMAPMISFILAFSA
jgi:NADH-quinone oxidoreductase subunit H